MIYYRSLAPAVRLTCALVGVGLGLTARGIDAAAGMVLRRL